MAIVTTALAETGASVLGGLFNLIDDLFTSEEERAAAKHKLLELHQKGELAQMGVNAVEAKHKSMFVAGWRPAVGWTCAAALAWTYVISPMLTFAVVSLGLPVDLTTLPILDLAAMMPILLGMLGLGAMRSFEKNAGVASDTMKGG